MTLKLSLLFFLVGAISSAKESSEFADKVVAVHGLSGKSAAQLKKTLTSVPGITRNIGTENPDVLQGPAHSWHPASRAQCTNKVLTSGLIKPNPEYESICGAKWMAPIPNYRNQPPNQATICIDQFEFPDIPCEYPMVWTPAPVAAQICESMGKRMCNSHEWEGACGGSIDEKDPYRFGLPNLQARRTAYNSSREKIWAFQWIDNLAHVTDSREVCGIFSLHDPEISEPMKSNLSQYYTAIGKSHECQQGPGSDLQTCGTNTWPAGFKQLCRTPQDVFDMHGNVAEVVNFPQSPQGLAKGTNTDKTERKGSFFVYRNNMYPDDCRVRQPYEHFNTIKSDGMAYYQEGFRCCKDIK